MLGDMNLTDILTSVLQQFFNSQAMSGNLRDGGPLSAKSIKNMRVVLDVAMKHVVSEGKIPENPVPLTSIKHLKSKRVEAMTDNEQALLEEYLFGRSDNYSNAANTPKGTAGSAAIFSIIETAKENGLNLYKYLKYIFNSAPNWDAG